MTTARHYSRDARKAFNFISRSFIGIALLTGSLSTAAYTITNKTNDFDDWSRGFSSLLLETQQFQIFRFPFTVETADSKVFVTPAGESLLDKAVRLGWVRVIVRLKHDNYQIEPELARAQFGDLSERDLSSAIENSTSVLEQRTRITETQTMLLDELAFVGVEVHAVKQFKYVPYIALGANRAILNALETSKLVESVIEDEMEMMTLAESIPRIEADTAWSNGFTGFGNTIAILDTGVEHRQTFLAGKVVSEACYSTNDVALNVESVCPNGAPSSTARDSGLAMRNVVGGSHGTHVAGIAGGREFTGNNGNPPTITINGVAKESSLISIQVFTKVNDASVCAGNNETAPCARTFISDQYKALERVYELRNSFNIAAANMSLGGGRHTTNCDAEESGPGGRKLLIDQLRAIGTATVIASGNTGYRDAISKPACISTSVSVGATLDTVDTVASFSNHSPLLSLLAPGDPIDSVSSGCGGIYRLSGTSMAAPHVAGAWGILKQKKPDASVTEILASLQTTGVPVFAGNATKRRIRVNAAMISLGGSGTPGCTQIPKELVIGKQTSGSITSTDCLRNTNFDEYSFYGNEGRNVAVNVDSNSLGTSITLYSPAGQLIANVSGTGTATRLPGPTGFVTLPQNGIYKLQVAAQNPGATGDYRVMVTSDTLMVELGNLSGSKAAAINNAGQIVGTGRTRRNTYVWEGSKTTDISHVYGAILPQGVTRVFEPLAINEAGQIAGYMTTNSTSESAVVYLNGQLTNVAIGNWQHSRANDVNDQGQVVGWMQPPTSQNRRAFIYHNGTTTDLGLMPGSTSCEANAINNAGVIVGTCQFPSIRVPFIYQNGVMSKLVMENWTFVTPTAINELGQIVGNGFSPNANFYRAFLYTAGVVTDLGTVPGGPSNSYATDINDSGQVVGWAYGDCSLQRTIAFVYTNGVMHGLGGFGGKSSQAKGINNEGVIVGVSTVPGDTPFALTEQTFAFKVKLGEVFSPDPPSPPKVMTVVPVLPGATNCYATSVNDSGHVVGYCGAFGTYRAFLYRSGIISDVGTLGGPEAVANGINNLGQIVGWSSISTGERRAFRYSNGVMTNLGVPPGWTQTYAKSINDLGQVSGDDGVRGFRWFNGAFTLFGVGTGNGINNNGSVAGTYRPVATSQAYLFANGTQSFPWATVTEPSSETHAYAINAVGFMVGGSNDESAPMGPLQYRAGKLITVAANLAATHLIGSATSINDSDEIAGYFKSRATGPFHAFAYSGGRWTAAGYVLGKGVDLGTLGGAESRATDINRSGQVVGHSQLPNGQFRAFITNGSRRAPFDFDRDGKTDVAIFRPAPTGGEWWWQRSSDNQVPATPFGLATDVIAPGDFTGDGKLDITVWRPSNGFWYILRSEDNSFYGFPFGAQGDVPMTADYDGDGKDDPTVFRASVGQWYITRSSDNQVQTIQFGLPGDVPVAADYDGDGRADVAIKRSGPNGAEWWINRSTQGVIALIFGASTDLAVPGDYTGDGKADVASFRPSTGSWFVLRSEDFSFYGFPFGQNGDMPVSGDYDGDGKIDPAVFRPSAGIWFISGSTSGMQIKNFGIAGDRPIPNAFVR